MGNAPPTPPSQERQGRIVGAVLSTLPAGQFRESDGAGLREVEELSHYLMVARFEALRLLAVAVGESFDSRAARLVVGPEHTAEAFTQRSVRCLPRRLESGVYRRLALERPRRGTR